MTTTQRIVKIRRDYNTWVANETIEDYALRYTPRAFRRWSVFRVSNTAFGAISFLVLEAIGGTIAVNYGFINALWAIMAVGLIIFLTGLPISYYAARYGVDMDLLTRGAGFGYIGSTITSFVYASFTFILFALEAAIMAYALELYFGLPLWIGYMVSALIVIPLVTHGVTLIAYPDADAAGVADFDGPALYRDFPQAPGASVAAAGLCGPRRHAWPLQCADVRRGDRGGRGADHADRRAGRLPALHAAADKQNRLRWHFGVLMAGPGWILLGIAKMLGGALLAWLCISSAMPLEQAVNPTQMYLAALASCSRIRKRRWRRPRCWWWCRR
jgi:hypothetical protein